MTPISESPYCFLRTPIVLPTPVSCKQYHIFSISGFFALLHEGRKARHINFSSEPHSPHFLVPVTLKSSSFDYYVLKSFQFSKIELFFLNQAMLGLKIWIDWSMQWLHHVGIFKPMRMMSNFIPSLVTQQGEIKCMHMTLSPKFNIL